MVLMSIVTAVNVIHIKCNKLIVTSQNCLYVSIPSFSRGGGNGEER